VIPEAPFLFSIAGLSASLAGLAGLGAARRRGADLRPIDAFRLREIVEFAFANILFCIGLIPLAQLVGASDAVRVAAILALIYVLGSIVILARRTQREQITVTLGWRVVALGTLLINVLAAAAVIVTSSMAAYDVMLAGMLARPMLVFLLVLSAFEAPPSPPV
jgi:hypothetical protein